MIKQSFAATAAVLGALALTGPAQAMGNCASAEQTEQVQAYYAEGGGIPWQAQTRGGLDMSEELIASALPAVS